MLEDQFFSSGERLDLVHGIIVSNRKHRGAEILLPAVAGRYTAKQLGRMSERQLAWALAHMGLDVDAEGVQTADLLARALEEVKAPAVKALIPLHQV